MDGRLERFNKPRPVDLHILKECGYSIGDSVWIRPNSSDWCYDWRNVEFMVIGVNWNYKVGDWEFTIIDKEEVDILYELDLNVLTRYNGWE